MMVPRDLGEQLQFQFALLCYAMTYTDIDRL